MIDGNRDRSHNRQCTEACQETCDQQPTADNFRKRSDLGEKDWEGEVKWADECVSKILDIGQLLVTMVNEKGACNDPQNQNSEIRKERLSRNGSQHLIYVSQHTLIKTRSFVKKYVARGELIRNNYLLAYGWRMRHDKTCNKCLTCQAKR